MTNKHSFFDNPANKKIFYILLWALIVMSIAAEIPLHRHSHFAEHGIDAYISFYGVLSFLTCFFSIVIANTLGKLIQKKGNYYDRDNI